MKNLENSQKVTAELPLAKKPDVALAIADLALTAHTNAAAVIAEYSTAFGKQDLRGLADSLSASMQHVHKGEMSACEAMLFTQAQALQSIFVNLSCRAANQTYIDQQETFLRLAFRAQNQCRTTLETLATLKNPPVVFAKQANIAQGHQQVNNVSNTHQKEGPRARKKNQISTNELLEESAHE